MRARLVQVDPEKSSPSQIRVQTGGAFSPMPPAKTSVSNEEGGGKGTDPFFRLVTKQRDGFSNAHRQSHSRV